MISAFGVHVLYAGIILTIAAQIGIALYAFTGNPFQGIACFVIPLYVWAYARKHKVGRALMICWYVGIALFVLGGVMIS